MVGKKTFQNNISITLPEAIIALENGWLVQMKFPFGARPIFRGYVSFREGMLINLIDTCTKNFRKKPMLKDKKSASPKPTFRWFHAYQQLNFKLAGHLLDLMHLYDIIMAQKKYGLDRP